MSTPAEYIRHFNEKRITEQAERVYAAQLATLGTVHAASIDDIADFLRDLMETHKEYLSTDWFFAKGMAVKVNRQASPWPTFEVYIPATTNFYLRPEED